MQVSFNDLLLSFEFVSGSPHFDCQAYISRKTGEIHWVGDYVDEDHPVPEDVEDGQKYLAVPHKNDLDLGKRLVYRFAEEVIPDQFDTVAGMFSARGAYRRFRDFLDRRGLTQAWHAYESNATEKALREWCSENGIAILPDERA